jgi:hypothetical protein
MKAGDSTIRIPVPSANWVTRRLLAVVAVLIALSVAGQVSKYFLGHPQLKGFVSLFYVDGESNVPTGYSSLALALGGALLLIVAWAKMTGRDRYRRHWALLAAVFFGLSIDEVAMLHEYPIEPLRAALHAEGFLYYTWVIPGILFVCGFAISFARFLRDLPAPTRRGFLLAGAVFVSGAIGVEMLSGLQADLAGEENFAYAMIITLEESLEMIGVVLFIRAVLRYLERQFGEIHFHLGRSRAKKGLGTA